MILKSFTARVALSFGCLFALSFGLLSGVWYAGLPALGVVGESQENVRAATRLLELTADFERAQIMSGLQERRGDIMMLSDDRRLAELLARRAGGLQEEAFLVLDQVNRAHPDKYSKLIVVDPASRQILASDARQDVGRLFVEADLIRRAGEPGVIELVEQIPGDYGAPALIIARQLRAVDADGFQIAEPVGIIVAYVDLSGLLGDPTFQSQLRQGAGQTLLEDGQGWTLAQFHTGANGGHALNGARQVAVGFEGTLHEKSLDGGDLVVVYRYIPISSRQGWRMAHFQSLDSMLGPLRGRSEKLAAIGLLLSIASLAMIGLAARRVVRPLKLLADAARRLGAGDFSVRAQTGRGDARELATLAEAFNAMAASVQAGRRDLERRVVERTKELAQERDTAQRYLDTAGVMLMGLDDVGRISLINRKGCAILGRTEQEILWQDWFENFLPEETRDMVREVFGRLMRGEAQLFAVYENEILDAQGRRRKMLWNNVLLHDADGRICGTFSSAEDITERRQADAELESHRHHLEELVETRTQALRLALEQAEAASRSKSMFLANMSHELRTPMNAIMGMTNIAMRRTDDPRVKDCLGKAEAASKHLLQIINDILDLSKVEADRLQLEQTDFTLKSILDHVVSMTGDKAAGKGLHLLIDVDAALAQRVWIGDPVRLGQVLINLVGNAVKFTEHGGVTVRSRREGGGDDHVLLYWEVIDTGIGISATDQQRLFAPFEQVDGSMTRRYGGTGLGLAISKRLVELMGGEIGVKSEYGRGSVFWFTSRLKIATAAGALNVF